MNLYLDDDVQPKDGHQSNSRFEQYERFKSCLYEDEPNSFKTTNLLQQESKTWKSNFPYLRIVGKGINPPPEFQAFINSAKSANEIFADEYRDEEVFAEHHDEIKLEQFNSADNLIDAIAYHSTLQGNKAQTNFWDSDETEISAESDHETDGFDYGKTFRIDSGNDLPRTHLVEVRSQDQTEYNSDDEQYKSNKFDMRNIDSIFSNCDDSNNRQQDYDYQNEKSTKVEHSETKKTSGGYEIGLENSDMYLPNSLNNISENKYTRGLKDVRKSNIDAINRMSSHDIIQDDSFDCNPKCATETHHTENSDSYYDSISGHASRLQEYVPSKLNIPTDNERDSLASLKTASNKSDFLKNDDASYSEIDDIMTIKHNVAPFYCNIRKPYVQDKGRFSRPSHYNTASTSSRGHLSSSTLKLHPTRIIPQYNITNDNSSFNSPKVNKDMRSPQLNIKQNKSFICRNQYKNSETPRTSKTGLNLQHNKSLNDSIYTKQLKPRKDELDDIDVIDTFANESDFVINNFSKLEISRAQNSRKEEPPNCRRQLKYYENHRTFKTEFTPSTTYEGCIQDVRGSKYINSKSNKYPHYSVNKPAKNNIPWNCSAHHGDHGKSVIINSPRSNYHSQNIDSYHNNNLKSKSLLYKNEGDSARNLYYTADSKKISEPYVNYNYPLNMAVQDIKLENIQKSSSSKSSIRNKYVNPSQHEKKCHSSRPPTSVSLKTLSPIHSAGIGKCVRGNRNTNVSIFTNLTTRKTDRPPPTRNKFFGNHATNYRTRCLLPIEQELTKPLNQSKKFLGNPSILEYSVNKGRIESVNSEPKGSTWNLNHFNKIPPINGSKI